MEKIHKHLKEKQLTVARNWKLFAFLGTISLIAFIIFTFMVRADFLRPWDFDMTVRLQDEIPLRFDSFLSLLSVMGRFEYLLALLVVILIWRRRIFGIIPFFLFGLAHVLELIGKTILEQPGPPKMFLRSQFGDFPGLYIFTDASYPSGHSLRAVFISVIIFYLTLNFKRLPKPVKLTILAGIFALLFLILISRVSLGEHWTTDVIGGALLGLSFAFFSLIFI